MPKDKDEHGYTPDNYQPLLNKEAIVAFNGKTLLTSQSYLDVKAYEHALAFTVAGLMDEDLLKDVRDGVASALENGEDFATFKRRLKPYLMAKGWLAQTLDDGTTQLVAGSNRRLQTIFHTNLQTAYAAGQWQRIQETKEFLPYLRYMPSLSANPRHEHQRYYGICRPVDDPIWQSIMPPNGWGCKCWVKQLTRRQAEKVGISDETPLETEKYTNPKTGQTSDVPVGVDPSFAHNHDRFTALIRLAEDKHGRLFANNLKDEAQKLMPATLPVGVPTVPVASGETVTDTVKPPVKTPEQPQPTPETEINWDELISQWLEYDVESSKLGQYEYAYKRLDKKKFPLSKEEFIALRHYTANGFKDLNRYLRGDLPADSDIQTLFDNVEKLLNNGLEKLPIYKKPTVIRRISLEPEQIDEYVVGETVTFKAFTSTTTNAKDVKINGDENVRFVIQHKTGRDVRELSQHKSEGEVLLGSPTNYLITKYTDYMAKKGYVEIELLEL